MTGLLGQVERMARLNPCLLQMTGVGQGKRVQVGERGFHFGFSPAEGELALHSRPVALHKGDPVSRFQKLRDLELALNRLVKHTLRFGQTAKRNTEVGNQGIPECPLRIECGRFPGFFERFLVVAVDRVNPARQQSMRMHLARVTLCPRLAGRLQLFRVSQHPQLVCRGDEKLLHVARAIAELPRLPDVLCREVRLSDLGVQVTQRGIRHGEARIQCAGAFVKRQSRSAALRSVNHPSLAVHFQSFERGRGHFKERVRVFPHRRGRLAGPGSEIAGHLAQGVQDQFFLPGLCLRFEQHISPTAARRAQPQHVLVSERRDRAFQDRGASGSLTDLPGDFWSESRICGPAHQKQRPLDPLLGNQAQERRLLQLHRQGLPKRTVEDGIGGLIFEFGEDNRVTRAQRMRAVEKQECSGGDCDGGQASRRGKPPVPIRARPGSGGRRAGPLRPEPLQVRTETASI
jgi:hypothetical protein